MEARLLFAQIDPPGGLLAERHLQVIYMIYMCVSMCT
tara:strand:- start:89 stop:199 length:111 start_codon:yes stop_codon:yes gene_type:complete